MIIGITGFLRSGKDTVAEMIRDIDPTFSRYSLADPIKDAAKEMFRWNDNHVYGELKDKVDPYWGISPRFVLQLLGTEFAQYLLCEKCEEFKNTTGRNMWVKRFEREMMVRNQENWLIPDLRFPHEVEFLQKRKSPILKVVRELATPDRILHESEKYVNEIPFTFEIQNNGSMEDLRHKVRICYNSLMGSLA